MEPRYVYTTNHKALKVNLDTTFYGTFAEIGAGQEVVRKFFKAGGASGTIAKAMSAYDMSFSDSIYGKEETGRYVSRSRLKKMLEHEWNLLVERLKGEKYQDRRFFVFADTVTTINYTKTNKSHGWLGVRFQSSPGDEYNEVILHVNLLDTDSSSQQNALSILGVNLIFACRQFCSEPNTFLDSLGDNLPMKSIEIDMISMKGNAFKDVDNRLLSLILVTKGYSKAACFLPDGQVVQPKDFLYKKNVCVLRSRFRPVTNLNLDMLKNGVNQFKEDQNLDDKDILTLCEITLNNLSVDEDSINIQDFLDRAEILCRMGYPVMVSNFPKHSELTRFLKDCKPKKIGIILGVLNLLQIFNTDNYENPISDLLTQFGELFSQDVKLYAYPYKDKTSGEIKKKSDVDISSNILPLLNFIDNNRLISDIENFKPEFLDIFSSELIEKIKKDEDGWEKSVPKEVSDIIIEKCLFDYPCEIEKRRKKINENIFETSKA